VRTFIVILLLAVTCLGIYSVLVHIPFGTGPSETGTHYLANTRSDTGASNAVTAVVVGYRGFDTLGEVTVLFLTAMGVGAVLATLQNREKRSIEKASLILTAACRFLFPLTLLFGAYIFLHGHLTPGGGFQGGAVIASGFLLVYLGCHGRRISRPASKVFESAGGLLFVGIGLAGLYVGSRFFLSNFLPAGEFNTLLSAGIIPVIYIGVGIKVGAELTGIIDRMMEDT